MKPPPVPELWTTYPPGKLLAWLLNETPAVWATLMTIVMAVMAAVLVMASRS